MDSWTSELTDILAKLKVITIFACLATYNSQRKNISMNDASTKRLGRVLAKTRRSGLELIVYDSKFPWLPERHMQ